MDPPADYNRYREHRDPPPDGRYPQSRAREQWSPTGFRETGFHGHMDRLGKEDRGTFFPPGGVQQPFRPLPQKNGDQMGFTRVPSRGPPYQESFRGRYLGGKSRHESISSRGSNEQIRFAYDNSGFQPKYREPEMRSDGSLASAQRGYIFNTDLGKTRGAKENYDDNNYIYRSRKMANGGPGSTSKMNGTKYRQHDIYDEMKKDRPKVGFSILLRFFTCVVIFWDLANDWIVGASGPSPFVQQDNLVNKGKCDVNNDVFDHLNINTSEVMTSICSDTVNAWTSLTVFMLLGSLIAMIQCINITIETVSIVRRKKLFRILSGQSEIFLTLFLEEIPQAIIMIVLLFHCKCPKNTVDVNLFALLASISACTSAILRLCVSYDHMTGNAGCCNQWWRCCFCRNNDYCCEVKPRDFFCTCEIPFPICCCTLSCKDCKCSPVTWCNFILKTFGCFCDCCQDKDVSYGIRLVNLFGISLLLLSVGLQIFVFVVTVH